MKDEAKENLRGIIGMTDEDASEIEAKLQAISADMPYEAEEAVDEAALEDALDKAITETPAEESAEPVAEEATAEAADDATEALTLPDNYVRSLLASGWSQEDITEQSAALGDEFAKVAEKIHSNRVRESREWAAHGRIAADQASAVKDGPIDAPNPLEELKRIDVEALKAEFGTDEQMTLLLERIAGPLNKTIEAANVMFPSVAESAARQKESEQAALQNEVNGFFDSPDLRGYKDLYGAGPMGDLTDADYQQRMRVMEQADQIRVGASYQGRIVGLTEAMGLAHDSLSADYTAKAIREELKAKVKERSNAITNRPSKVETTVPEAGSQRTEKTRDELNAAAAIALREVFGK